MLRIGIHELPSLTVFKVGRPFSDSELTLWKYSVRVNDSEGWLHGFVRLVPSKST